MKNLIFAVLIFTAIGTHAQTNVITNIDGTQSTVTRKGNIIVIANGSGKNTTITNKGNNSVVTDGSRYITFARQGGTTTMTSSNGSMYSWVDAPGFVKLVNVNGNFSSYDRNATPFSLSVGGNKFYVTVYQDAYTLEHLDGSNLVTTVIGDKVTTDFPAATAPLEETFAGIRSKIANKDGTYTTIIMDGDTYKVKTEYTITRVGNKSIIHNPDGSEVETNIADLPLKLPAKKAKK